jgi:RimJ/RimL family protein N-acetyltransferase
VILTPRLRLRALSARDLTLFRTLYCDAKIMRHIGKPLSPALAAASLRATVAATRKPGGLRFYVIVERQSRRGIGMCSLRPAAWDKRGVELGIMLLPFACGRGHAREAMAALIRFAFAALPATAVWVQHSRANVDAARLNVALGFRPVRRTHPHGARHERQMWKLKRPGQLHSSNQPTKGKTMSKIIGFLEQAGRDAAMRHANREALLKTMREQEMTPIEQSALLHAQMSVLDDLTGARETMYCHNQSIKAPQKKKAPTKKKPAKKAPAKKPAKKAPAKKR